MYKKKWSCLIKNATVENKLRAQHEAIYLYICVYCVYICISLPVHSATVFLRSSCFTLIARWRFYVQFWSSTICDTVLEKISYLGISTLVPLKIQTAPKKPIWKTRASWTYKASGESSYVFTRPFMGSIISILTSVFSEGTPVNELNYKRQDSNNWSLESKLSGQKVKFLCLKSTAYIYGCILHCIASQKRKQNQSRQGYSHHKQFPCYCHYKK